MQFKNQIKINTEVKMATTNDAYAFAIIQKKEEFQGVPIISP